MIENKDQLIDIYGIWYEPFWLQNWFKYCVILCGGVCIGSIIWYLYKKYVYKKIVVDCKITALQDLDDLKKFHIVTSADSKDSYFRLSLIIKNYLRDRYDIASLQLTDKEIVEQSHHVMSDESCTLLQTILKSMTLIKFEHQFVRNEKLEKDIQAVIDFVNATTQDCITKEI